MAVYYREIASGAGVLRTGAAPIDHPQQADETTWRAHLASVPHGTQITVPDGAPGAITAGDTHVLLSNGSDHHDFMVDPTGEVDFTGHVPAATYTLRVLTATYADLIVMPGTSGSAGVFGGNQWAVNDAATGNGLSLPVAINVVPSYTGTLDGFDVRLDSDNAQIVRLGLDGPGTEFVPVDSVGAHTCEIALVVDGARGAWSALKSATSSVQQTGDYNPGDNNSGDVYLSPRFATQGAFVSAEHISNYIRSTPAENFTCEWIKVGGRDVTHLWDAVKGGFYPDGPGLIEGVIVYGGVRYAVSGKTYRYIPLRANPLWASEWNGNGFFAGIDPYPTYGPGQTVNSVTELRNLIQGQAGSGGTLIIEDCNFDTSSMTLSGLDYNGLTVIARNLNGVKLFEINCSGASNLTVRGFYVRNMYFMSMKGNVWLDYWRGRNLRFRGSSNGAGPGYLGRYQNHRLTRCLHKWNNDGPGEASIEYHDGVELTQTIHCGDTGGSDCWKPRYSHDTHYARNVTVDWIGLKPHDGNKHPDGWQTDFGEISGAFEYNFTYFSYYAGLLDKLLAWNFRPTSGLPPVSTGHSGIAMEA